MLPITPEEIKNIFSGINCLKCGVVGDFCLDVYLTADPSFSEKSLETGLQTLPVVNQHYSPGGAGNVARNLTALGAGEVRGFGVTGNDIYGTKLREVLMREGVDISGLEVQRDSWATNTYVKIYEKDEENRRIDFGGRNLLMKETADILLKAMEEALPELDVIIINQQLKKGVHTEYFRKKLAGLINSYSEVLCIVDSRDYNDDFDNSYRKVNEHEGAVLCGWKHSPGDLLPFNKAGEMAELLYRRWGKPLFLTRGAYGCIVCDENGFHEIPGIRFFSRIDTVGAGDSFLAASAAALSLGSEPGKAAAIGNLAAGVTVGKLMQTGTASETEILKLCENAMYGFNPALAFSSVKARYIENTGIEIVTEIPSGLHLKYAVFDHDGTISTLRQGWEEVMEPMMIGQILGDYYQEADETEIAQVRERVRDYIDKTTGVQTLVQMKGLIDLIREFGYVPENSILDEKGYKGIYNNELMKRVDKRVDKLKRGELNIQDFTIKNAVSFLKFLKKRGTALYLASGTDQSDVKNEAEILGYSEAFNGCIYGSIGEINHEPKRRVLEKILSDIGNLSRDQAAVFGDGPVEIREAQRAGVLAVGVASDEVRRYGLNSAKRTRLIEAGADIIIPDFSQKNELIKILFQ